MGNKESDEGLMAIPTGKTFGEIGIWNVTFDDNGNPFNLLKPLGAGSVSIWFTTTVVDKIRNNHL